MNPTSFGLLVLRISIGFMMGLGHGLPKAISLLNGSNAFPDPFGIGPSLSLSLAVFAELFCSIALIAGVKVRTAAFFPLFTMAVACFFIHGGDPWAKKELCVLYAVPFLTLMITGGGEYTLENQSKYLKGPQVAA